MRRRDFIRLGARLGTGLAAIYAARPTAASAQSYPVRPVKLVVPYPPGGVVDVVARHWAEKAGSIIGGYHALPHEADPALLLQALAAMSGTASTLYVSGEESAEQVALRAGRLALDAGRVELLAEIQLERIGVAQLDHVFEVEVRLFQLVPELEVTLGELEAVEVVLREESLRFCDPGVGRGADLEDTGAHLVGGGDIDIALARADAPGPGTRGDCRWRAPRSVTTSAVMNPGQSGAGPVKGQGGH